MKNIIRKISVLASIALIAISCEKSPVAREEGMGELSFQEFSINIDDEIITKAETAAPGNYSIIILDSDANEVKRTSYSAVKESGNKISLKAGQYTLVARSQEEEVPTAAFEQPVYGATKAFDIEAGKVTSVGNIVCTLVQCKVTVTYSDEFLAMVTGDGSTKVAVNPTSPLTFALNGTTSTKTYEQSAGYFAVSENSTNTMTVEFSGEIEGKKQKMSKIFTGVAAKQWRQVKFVKKVNEQGDATFDITIADLISDGSLNEEVGVPDEDIIGEDPNAPKGDGNITLEIDHAAGCDSEITDLSNILIVPVETRDMSIKLKASVPNGIKGFKVNISSTSDAFTAAVAAADATNLDLINPTATNDIIFTVVPFPHGSELVGQKEVAFDLSAAQDAIIAYPGNHTFNMVITDQNGCKKEIPVVMVVE